MSYIPELDAATAATIKEAVASIREPTPPNTVGLSASVRSSLAAIDQLTVSDAQKEVMRANIQKIADKAGLPSPEEAAKAAEAEALQDRQADNDRAVAGLRQRAADKGALLTNIERNALREAADRLQQAFDRYVSERAKAIPK